jgi:hypothetical protein
MHGVDVLLNDYEKNSLDPPDLRTKLIPLMRRTLTACWRYETSEGYEDLVKLDSQNPDPLYSYCLMKATSDYRLIIQIFEKAKLATPTRPTHPLLRCLINSSAKKSNGDIPVDQQVIIVESFVDFVSHQQEDQANLSLLFASVKSMIDRSNAYVAIDLASQLDALKSPSCPEWIMQYFMSSINKKVASYYRGSDFIDKVPLEDLKRFEKASETASKHLLRAWTLAPNEISLYEDLINLEARSGVTNRPNEVWLRHALATKIDCNLAFSQYVWFLQPRWGGTEAKMFWLADKCSEAIGVEGDLPFYYSDPLRVWCEDNAYHESMNRPSVLKSTLRIVEYLQKKPEDYRHPMIYGECAAMMIRVLWDAGHLSELKWILDRYSSALGGWRMVPHSLELSLIESVCHAASQEGAFGCWEAIHSELLLDNRNLDSDGFERLRLALEEAETYSNDDRSKFALTSCQKLYGWAKSYHDGKETVLDFDENMLGWMVAGKYQRFDTENNDPNAPKMGVDIGVSFGSRSSVLKPLIRFSPPYTIEADVQLRGSNIDQMGLALQAGPFHIYSSDCRGMELRISPLFGLVTFDETPLPPNINQRKTASLTAPEMPHRLRLDIELDRAAAFLDNKEIGTYEVPVETHGVIQFGRDTAWGYPETKSAPGTLITFGISNVKITRTGIVDQMPITSNSNASNSLSAR